MKLFKKKNKKGLALSTPWLEVYKEKDINPNVDYGNFTMYEKILQTKENFPYNIAYQYFKTSSTYKKFVKDIDICARSFKSVGVKEKDVVTICMPNTPEALIAFYALNKIGAIANMIHPLSSENEIKNYLNEASCEVLLAVDLVWPKINEVRKETGLKKIILVKVSDSMDLLTSFGYWFISGRKAKKINKEKGIMFWKDFFYRGKVLKDDSKAVVNPKDVAVMLHSGGTTGKPKGIMLSSESFNSVAIQEIEVCKDLKENLTILSAMPIFHGFGLGSTIHAPFCVGATCILLPQFSAKKFGSIISKNRPNIIAGVPTLYEALINSSSLKRKDLRFLKCAICGGDTLTPALKDKVDTFFREHNSKTEVRASFGMTECTSGVTMMPKNSGVNEGIGVPCPHSYVKIVAPNTHTELPYGKEGELCINGPSVMLGYLNEPKETAHALQIHEDGKTWLHTGDLGYMDERGYVYFKQRLKRMIVSSGYNVYPGQIEEIIEKHPDVLSCTVIGIDHPYKVQVPKAFIVLKEGVEESFKIKQSIKELCEENIAIYAIPHEFEFRKSLPTTLVGKVAFRELEEEEKNKQKESSDRNEEETN